jgi:hypothetical protein
MRITVIADSAGSILGFSYDPPGHAHTGAPATALGADEGQTLHSVDLTPELMQRLGDDTFDDELYRHVVVKKGKTASLSLAKPGKR